MKILINIQSLSDIITNSSSELFCVVSGDNIETYKNLFTSIIGEDGSVTIDNKEYLNDFYDSSFYDEMREQFTDQNIMVSIGWDVYNHIDIDIIQRGIISKLNDVIGKDNYKIYFNEEF